jgi:hypothetical protein
MKTNLTENQLKLANWLADQNRKGVLKDEFTVRWELSNYKPEKGKIEGIVSDQLDITFASLLALESEKLILTTHKLTKPGQKSGEKKINGVKVFQYGWATHEISRTFTLLGSIFELAEQESHVSQISPVSQNSSTYFIDQVIIEQIQHMNSINFDFSRLAKYAQEINDNFREDNYSSVIFLARAILDHCPPIFGQSNFDSVVAQYGGQSFKSTADKLNSSLKKIADFHIHKQIGRKEVLPAREEINFSNDLNFLLARIIEEAEKK